MRTTGCDVFLSHAWGTDALGRNTHARARALRDELRRRGWSVWFDEDELVAGRDVDASMCAGVESARAVCFCVTRRLLARVDDGCCATGVVSNNCAKEWNAAMRCASGVLVIPVIFEPQMLDLQNWPSGVGRMHLASRMYVDASGTCMHAAAREISRAMWKSGARPRWHESARRSRTIHTIVHV